MWEWKLLEWLRTNGASGTKEFVRRLDAPLFSAVNLAINLNSNHTFRYFGRPLQLIRALHPRQVVGGAGQGPLHGYFGKSFHRKPPHTSLLLQDSVHRFDNRFASCSFRRMRRMGGAKPQTPAAIQPPRQIRVGKIRIHVSLFHGFKLSVEENPLSALTRCGRSPHCLSTSSTIGSGAQYRWSPGSPVAPQSRDCHSPPACPYNRAGILRARAKKRLSASHCFCQRRISLRRRPRA